MADLRALLESLGYVDVRTLLNSGNAVFAAPGMRPADAAARIESAMTTRLGVSARVLVLSAQQMTRVVDDNLLTDVATDPSRLLVTVYVDESARNRLDVLAGVDHAPEILAIGARAAYIWCADGILASRLVERTGRLLGDAATTRNWSTITKLYALLTREGGQPPLSRASGARRV